MSADEATELHGTVAELAIGERREGPKHAVVRIELLRGSGIVGDGQAGNGHRQVSFLTEESRGACEGTHDSPDDHVRTRGIALDLLTDGRRLRVGSRAVVQVTERLLSRVFARVLRGGEVNLGDVVATDPTFDRPRFAVFTLSDRSAAGTRADDSGPLAARLLGEALRTTPIALDVLADDATLLTTRMVELADDDVCDLIVTTGGTGLAPRDVTPEATLAAIDREVPGIAEAIRAGGLAKTPFAMLSRGVCGQRGATLIVNLSGSPKAVREQLAILIPVLPHVLTTASGVPQKCAVVDADPQA